MCVRAHMCTVVCNVTTYRFVQRPPLSDAELSHHHKGSSCAAPLWSPSPVLPTTGLYISLIWSFQEHFIDGITQHVAFGDSLSSLARSLRDPSKRVINSLCLLNTEKWSRVHMCLLIHPLLKGVWDLSGLGLLQVEPL